MKSKLNPNAKMFIFKMILLIMIIFMKIILIKIIFLIKLLNMYSLIKINIRELKIKIDRLFYLFFIFHLDFNKIL